MPKDGTGHLRSLQDGRDIRLNGERIGDPTQHPAFRNACRTAAGFYDFQSQPDHLATMTFETETGARAAAAGSFPPAMPSWSSGGGHWRHGRNCISGSSAVRRITSRRRCAGS